MKITKEVRKKYLAVKFRKDILPDLELTKAEKDKVELSIKTLIATPEVKNVIPKR